MVGFLYGDGAPLELDLIVFDKDGTLVRSKSRTTIILWSDGSFARIAGRLFGNMASWLPRVCRTRLNRGR